MSDRGESGWVMVASTRAVLLALAIWSLVLAVGLALLARRGWCL
jgi:hypothetical protein